MSAVDDAFNSLFYGAGSWFGLLLFLIISVSFLIKFKYSAALLMPIMFFFGITYLDNNLTWHAGIMFFSAIFCLIYVWKGKGR